MIWTTHTSVSSYQAYNFTEEMTGVMVKCSPISPWIEVYHDGELTSEWQPKDGEIYRFLMDLLEDDLYAPVPVERLEYAPMLAALIWTEV